MTSNEQNGRNIVISRVKAQILLREMREVLNIAACEADTVESEAVIEHGWKLYDLVQEAFSQKAEDYEQVGRN